MFTLRDGREHLYQWDIDRQVIVKDLSITEVHFCNRTDDCSLVVEVKEDDGLRIANVPNILLQSSFDIRVFGYDGKATMHDKVFKVKARTKPADYVYTETEIISIEQLEEKLRNDMEAFVMGTLSEMSKAVVYLDVKGITETVQSATADIATVADRLANDEELSIYLRISNAEIRPAEIVIMSYDSIRISTDQIINSNSGDITKYEYHLNRSEGIWNVYRAIIYKPALITSTELKTALNDYASIAYVDNAIANIDIPEGGGGSSADLSNYYNKEEVDNLISESEKVYWLKFVEGTITDEDTIEYLNKVLGTGEKPPAYVSFEALSGDRLFTISNVERDNRYNKLYLQTDLYLASNQNDLLYERIVATKNSNNIWQASFSSKRQVYTSKTYVDNAIQTALSGIATAEGGAY